MKRLFWRLLPDPETKEALRDVKLLKRMSSNSSGMEIGFGIIEKSLIQRICDRPEELHTALKTTGYPIPALVAILARNIVCDELESGRHMLFNQLSMSGMALRALHGHLTEMLEHAGVETAGEANASRAYVSDMLRERFGYR